MRCTRQTITLGLAALAVPPLLTRPAVAQTQGMFDGEALASDLDQLHARVVQGGATLYERAFAGGSLDTLANVKSVSKTLLALLTGIAIEGGALAGTEVMKVLPALGRPETGDVRDEMICCRCGQDWPAPRARTKAPGSPARAGSIMS